MFVIPMLGKSSRFFKSGYQIPKYKLPIGDSDLFSFSVSSFKEYFKTDRFVFIVRSDFSDMQYFEDSIVNLGIKNFSIKQHLGDTKGQAESVQLALESEDSIEELYIFNIDTILFNFSKENFTSNFDGYLEVFIGEGDHWSFILPAKGDNENLVERVVEKNRISNLCSNGLYYFKTTRIYLDALNEYKTKFLEDEGELYVAPLYQTLIDLKFDIRYKLIKKKDIGFCGVPSEYESFIKTVI
jgi:hypothetical protein